MMRRMRKPRANHKPPVIKVDVDAWLKANPDYMIQCPHQPGNLKLSPAACAKRYLTANEPRWSNIGAEPFPIFVIKMNLIPCRNCEVGAEMARRQQEGERAA